MAGESLQAKGTGTFGDLVELVGEDVAGGPTRLVKIVTEVTEEVRHKRRFTEKGLLQSGVFGLGLFERNEVSIAIFPCGQEILIAGARLF